jgi:glycosyltransferase involved in cell wall biosynthesis
MPPSPAILILTSGPVCRNPRVRKEAEALSGAGYEVTVMTVANNARFEAFDAEILRTAKYRKVALDQFSGRGISGARAFCSRLRTWIAKRCTRFGLQSTQALGPTGALGGMARDFEADLTIVHTEMPFSIGCDLLARGRRVAADFEDWHSRDLLPETRSTRPIRLIAAAERELLRRSAYASTTSHAMAKALQGAYGGSLPLVISNSFPLQQRYSPPAPGNPPSFFWFSQTIGPGRGLELFLAAWQQTVHGSRLTLLGDIDDGYRSSLIQRLPVKRRESLHFLPITSPDDLPAVIAEHDIGVALELNYPMSRGLTITNKILQYLNAGIAVVASDTPGQREVLARSKGAGVLVDLFQTGELAAQLDRILADRPLLESMKREARRAAVEAYCWEREAPRLIAAVGSALQSPMGAPT